MNPFASSMPISLTGGAGGAAGASSGTSNNGFADNFGTPFNFDNSGWVVNQGTNGTNTTAGGNTGANATKQAASATPSASSSTGTGLMGALGNNAMPLLLVVGLVLLLSHKV